jgi:hypothetical protein
MLVNVLVSTVDFFAGWGLGRFHSVAVGLPICCGVNNSSASYWLALVTHGV